MLYYWNPQKNNISQIKHQYSKYQERWNDKTDPNTIKLLEIDIHALSKQDQLLRKQIFESIEEVEILLQTLSIQITSSSFRQDIIMGLALYSVLKPSQIGMRTIARNDFWKHIAVVVIPDLVWHRWGLNRKKNTDTLPTRFYSHSRRIWPKSVWWYIHLCWQIPGIIEENEIANNKLLWNICAFRTIWILQSVTTDHLLNLVERSSDEGYNIGLYRSLVKIFYEKYQSKANHFPEHTFRQIMQLSTALQYCTLPFFIKQDIKDNSQNNEYYQRLQMDTFVEFIFEHFERLTDHKYT